MSHDLGVVDAVGAAVPDWVAVVFALVTQLADAWFLFVLLATLYWMGDRFPVVGAGIGRRRAAFGLALAIGALTLSTALKAVFGHPRPPGQGTATGAHLIPEALRPLHESAATTDEPTFPSGHALAATLVYGGLALVAETGTRRARYAVATLLVVLISASRVVLGVHYLLDVVAGIVIGLLYLAVLWRPLTGRPNPGRAFGLALLVAVLGLFATGYERGGITALGTAIGGRLGWGVLGNAATHLSTTPRVVSVSVVAGLPVVGGLFVATEALEPPLPVTFLGAGFTIGLLLAIPVVADELLAR